MACSMIIDMIYQFQVHDLSIPVIYPFHFLQRCQSLSSVSHPTSSQEQEKSTGLAA
jgi:hypothetical protein